MKQLHSKFEKLKSGPASAVLMLCLTAALIFIVMAGSALTQEQPFVNSIEIIGLRRIEAGAVKAKITQRTGEPVENEKTAEDIKNIYRMGYFDDVRIEIEPFEGGVKLLYIVKEKPTVVSVEFQGNAEIKDERLREKIAVTIGSIADTSLIEDNANKLRRHYEEEGYWLARVVPVVNKINANEIALTFQIEEGGKVKIREIKIENNKALSDGKIKRAMKTGEWAIWSFLTSTGYFKKEAMNADIEAIKDLYFNNGYIKVAVAEPVIQLTEDRKGMIITIRVSEGEQYSISAIEVSGNKAFPEAELKKKAALSPGAVFNKEILKKDIEEMTGLYTQNGYALANIYPDISSDDAARLVKLTYRIEEGDIYRIGKVEVTGNTKTRDKVVRREFRLDEGDIFNSALLKRSYERINNLNFFESVDLAPKPRAEEKVIDVEIKVKERATGFLSIGGGYSSADKFIGMAEVTQGNLFGRGQYLRLKGELGSASSFFELSFRDPWFMDRHLAFTADIYKRTREYIDYDKKATGLGFGFGKSFGEYISGSISYNLEKATIYNIDETASWMIKEQEGTSVTSSITPSITRDTRDNFLDPSRGSKNSLYLVLAGFGGSNKFIKGVADSGWYFPVKFPLKDSTIALRGRLGYATGIFGAKLPVYERFYVGGIDTIRGLGFAEAGPRDENGELIGGTKELIINTEYIFPLIRDIKLKGLVFFDTGNSYSQDEQLGTLRYTAGLGIRWISPMGPIRIEWGYNIKKKANEGSNKIEFTFGSFF